MRATKQLIVALRCSGKLRASFERYLESKYRFTGFLYQREYSKSRVCRHIMEHSQPKAAATLVAVCQMNSTSDVDRNLKICKDLVRKAKSRGAKVCLLTLAKVKPWWWVGGGGGGEGECHLLSEKG